MLLELEGFVDLVKNWWDSFLVEGIPSFIFTKKLKASKEEVKKWNKQVFGNLGESKARVLDSFHFLDEKEGIEGLTEEDKVRRIEAQTEFAKIA